MRTRLQAYLRAEVSAMKKFQIKEALRQHRKLTNNEAALLWATTDEAVNLQERFRRHGR